MSAEATPRYDKGGFVSSGQKDRPGLLDYKIGIGMQSAVIDESHETSRGYPKSLMPFRGIEMDGFTVSLSYKRSRKPEAAAAGRRLFEEVLHAVENVIADFDPHSDGVGSSVADPQLSHGSPSIGASGPESRDASDLIVGEASGAGEAPSTPASDAPSEDAS